MVYHLGYAADVESHAGHSAGHSLHDGVGKVLGERRQHEHVGCVVGIAELLAVADIAQWICFEAHSGGYLLGMTAHHHHGSISGKLGMGCGELVAGSLKIVHTLVAVGGSLCGEEYQPLVGRQSEALSGLILVAGAEQVCVDGVGNSRYVLPFEQLAAPCFGGKPPAAGYESEAFPLEDALLAFPY